MKCVHVWLKSAIGALFVSLVALLPFNASAQDAPPDPNAALVNSNAPVEVEIAPYAPVAWGPHHRVWQRTMALTNADMTVTYRKNQFTELATGLCVQDSNGVWQAASDQIEITADGGQAIHGQSQVFFSGDINNGVDMTLPDGRHLVSHILGIALFDGAKSVLIASLTNAVGQLLPSGNQVLYDHCFSDLDCSIIYTYTKAGLSQDLRFNVNPATIPPEAYGLNPASTKIQLLTEFINPPAPEITQAVTGSGATEDRIINFTSMEMGQGKAFLLGDGSAPVIVRKHWQTVDNRVFLVEEVDYSAVAAQLQNLPPAPAPSDNSTNPPPGGILHKVSPKHLLPPPMLVKKKSQGLLLAKSFPKSQGYEFDYTLLVTGQSNFVFQSDSTYLVGDLVQLRGTTVFEGNSIIKFTNSATASLWLALSSNPMVWKNASYRPVVFTSKNDNSCGDPIVNSTGNPTNFYASTALDLTELNNPVVSNVRFSYMSNAIGAVGITLSDAQFNQCYSVFSPSSETFYLRNVLAYQIGGLQSQSCSCAATVTVENATFHFCTNFLNSYAGTTVALTNCLFVNVNNWNVGTVSTNSSYFTNNDAGIFQQVGGASHYVSTNSAFHNGTASINAALLADLRLKTVYPPIVYSNFTLTTNLTLYPQAPRNTNASLDIGYAYDPLDYVFTVSYVNTNLTLLNGVAIGTFGAWGIQLNYGSINSTGSPSVLNRIVHFNTVQEGATTNWNDNSIVPRMAITTTTNNPCQFRFTDWSTLALDGYHFYSTYSPSQNLNFWDNYFHGGSIYSHGPVLSVTNCLLERVSASFSAAHGSVFANFMNCEFFGGSLGGTTTGLNCTNNFFDRTAMGGGGSGDYNGYISGASQLNQNGAHDQTLTSINYQNGPLGAYYQTNSGNALLNAGNTNANLLGLYHYTVTTNMAGGGEIKEGTSRVTIGLHYVATDTNGIPYDTNGNGIIDAIEDVNGNGLDDAGESPWDLAISPQPQNTNVVQGANVTFTAGAKGIGPFTYQWSFNGTNIATATTNAYTKLVVLTTDAGNYSIVVSNLQAGLTNTAVLTVAVPLTITNQPVSITTNQGNTAPFTVGVSGTTPAYSWWTNSVEVVNDTRISGATGATLTISNTVGSDSGAYSAVITNLAGSLTSSAANLTIIVPPGITGPQNQTNVQATDATFSVAATGLNLAYQWSFNGTNIAGATNSSYTQLVVRTNDVGTYGVNVSNSAGSTNGSATLTVIVPPIITAQPSSVITNQGSNATFSVSVDTASTPLLSYQWFFNATNLISWATNVAMTVTNVQTTNVGGYSILVTNVAGTNLSLPGWLSVIAGGVTNSSGSNSPVIPTVTMISPTNLYATNPAVYLYGPAISIRASATDLGGFITNVAFYGGTNFATNFLGTAVVGTNNTYAWAWTNAVPGTNVLKAVATNNIGTGGSSATVYVIMDLPPTNNAGANVTLIWPDSGTTNTMLNGSVTDDGLPYGVTNQVWSVYSGDASKVSFFNSNAVSTLATFSASGVYVLQLRADDGFATNTNTCTITIKHRPVVYVTAPANNSTFLTGTAIALNAYATDPDGTVTNVQFFNGGTLLGTALRSAGSTYAFLWTNAPLWTNAITAVAKDNDNLSATSAATNVIVDPFLYVWFNWPANGQIFTNSPTNVFLTVTPISYAGGTITGVSFTNGSTFLAAGTPGTNSTYQYLWQDVTNGAYTVKVGATDSLGNTASNSVTFTLNAMPIVSIVTPTNLQSFLEVTNVPLSASATDSDGTISQVQFYSFTNLLGTVTTPGGDGFYHFTWSNRVAGTYPITALATDNRMAVSTSAIKFFIVNPTNQPPTVSITYPTNNASFPVGADITITATAADSDGSVTNVEFYVNGQPLGNDPTSPYSITKCCWEAGTNILTAKATDNLGSSTFATNIVITIGNPVPTSAEGFWDADFSWKSDFRYSEFFSMATDSAGNLYAGAWDINEGGTDSAYFGSHSIFCVAKWNGNTWSAMFPTNGPDDQGYLTAWSLKCDQGNLYVGGYYYKSTGLTNGGYVAKWDGTNWTDVGSRLPAPLSSQLYPLGVKAMNIAGSQLYIGGDFTNSLTVSNVQYIARLVGGDWSPVGNGLTMPTNGAVRAIAVIDNNIYIGGDFTAAGGNTNIHYLAMLAGNTWTNVGTGVNGIVRTLAVCNTNLYVGGDFTSGGGLTNSPCIAKWDGTDWSTLGNGVGGGSVDHVNGYYPWATPSISTICVHGNEVFVGGEFDTVFNGPVGMTAYYVAKATWDENSQSWTWSALDTGIDAAADPVVGPYVLASAIYQHPDTNAYDLFVGGRFIAAGAVDSYKVARWVVGGGASTNPPSITITNPPNFSVSDGSAISLGALVVPSGTQTVNYVEYYLDNVDAGPGYYPDFVNSPITASPGLHTITAVAYTTSSPPLSGAAKPVHIVVTNSMSTVTAQSDFFTVVGNGPPSILNVLTNDSTSTTNRLRIVSIAQVQNKAGTFQISHDASNIIYQPFPNAYGTEVFYYSVTDGTSTNSTYVTVTIHALPVINILTPPFDRTNASANVVVSGSAFDYDRTVTVTNVDLYVNGLKYGSTTNHAFSFNWSTNAVDFYTFVAVATDGYGLTNGSPPVTIAIYATNAPAHTITASITNLVPTTNTSFGLSTQTEPVITTGTFHLKGRAVDSNGTNLVSYTIGLYQPDSGVAQASDDPTVQAGIYASSPPFANLTPGPLNGEGFHIGGDTSGELGLLDLTGVPNGVYELVLQVRGGSEVTNTLVEVQLNSQLKLGQFSFSEQDLALPASGVPITITRTYNSMNPVNADFGHNWSFALGSMDVQLDEVRQDVTLGSDQGLFATDESSDTGLPAVVNVRTGGGRDVTLTLPDGRRTTFPCHFVADSLGNYTPVWNAPIGVNYTLTTTDGSYYSGLSKGWNNADKYAFDNYDIAGFLLTDNNSGIRYYIMRGAENTVMYDTTGNGNYVYAQVYGPPKLTQITQLAGDSLVIGDQGIAHYNATNGLDRLTFFERDTQNRITAIHDPISGSNGLPVVQYVYNQDTGNLIQVLKLADRVAGTYTTNQYHYDNPNFPHYITSIENAMGVPVAQNFYDASGKLVEVDDADGNKTQFIHNTTNSTEVVIDRLGHTNTFAYDPNGNVLATTNALGQISLMAYDSNNNKTNAVVFLNGQPYATNSYAYGTNNLLLSTSDPLGHSSSFVYNGYGQVTISTDARGNSSTNYYDGSTGNLLGTSDALRNTSSNFFDGNNLLIGSRDATGALTTNYYDASANLIATALSASGTILSTNTFAYDLNGNRTNSVVWRTVGGGWQGATNAYILDAQNRVIQTIEPDGGTNTVVYNAIGKQQATIDKLGHANSFAYDDQGRLVLTTFPDTTWESSAFDAAGNQTNTVDRAGRVTSYVFDALNRQVQTIFPDTTTNRTVYHDVGRVRFSVDARGTTNAFGYDLVGRGVSVTNAWGTSVAMTSLSGFDANGNQIYFTNAFGFITTNVFDVLNRQVQVQYPDGTKMSTGFDAASRRVAGTNQDGIVTLFNYDGAGRLITVTNALGKPEQTVTSYGYDEAGNETAQIDALNRTNTFTYDGLARRIAHTMPGAQTETFGYDFGGNLVRYTNFNGVVITNKYDVMNRLTNRASVNGYNASFAYSLTGQRATMTDASATTSYSYDNRDRLQLKTVAWNGGPTRTLNYQFDANGNLTNLWSGMSGGVTGGVTNFYQYDGLNRLTNVVDNGISGVNNTGYGYDKVGNLATMKYPNNVTNLWQYDPLNRLTNGVWNLNASALASFYYKLGLAGNRTNLSETVNGTSRTYAWSHDPLYRLKQETLSGGTTGTLAYSFDLVGNRTNRTVTGLSLTNQAFTFNTNDWQTNDVYDSNGNTITSGISYQYDALNHLTNANGGTVLIAYDGDGNRLKKTLGGTNTYYLIDDRNLTGYSQVLEEWTVSGGTTNLSRVYNYGLQLISQRLPAASTNYFIFDGLGSTRMLTDNGGNVANAFTYDAFGNLIASNAAPQTAYLYNCQQFDPDLGFYYLRARYYKPDTGRFWMMDTTEGEQIDPLSLHKYLYCEANPMNQIDPSGHGEFTIGSFSISANIVAGLAAFSAASIYEAKTHAIGTLLVVSYAGFHNAIGSWVDEWKFYNKKQTETVVTGLIATATTHVGYLEFGKGGGGSNPNDPKDHWRKEIKAALDRAKRLIEKRLTGDKQADLLKQVKELAGKADVTLE